MEQPSDFAAIRAWFCCDSDAILPRPCSDSAVRILWLSCDSAVLLPWFCRDPGVIHARSAQPAANSTLKTSNADGQRQAPPRRWLEIAVTSLSTNISGDTYEQAQCSDYHNSTHKTLTSQATRESNPRPWEAEFWSKCKRESKFRIQKQHQTLRIRGWEHMHPQTMTDRIRAQKLPSEQEKLGPGRKKYNRVRGKKLQPQTVRVRVWTQTQPQTRESKLVIQEFVIFLIVIFL